MQNTAPVNSTNLSPTLFREKHTSTRTTTTSTFTTTLSKVAPDPAGSNSNKMATKENGAGAAGDAGVTLRHVYLNDSQNNPTHTNVVKTSTYSWWNFIPLFLFFQFRRPANDYFLAICILQVSNSIGNTRRQSMCSENVNCFYCQQICCFFIFHTIFFWLANVPPFYLLKPSAIISHSLCFYQVFPMWTITKGVPTMALPLLFILGVAAIKEILEDMDKHKADNIENGAETDVLDPATKKWVRTKWSTLRCGQLVRIKNREFVPADIVLVGSSDQINNGVFINTKNLDGETDLKIREVPDALIKKFDDDASYAAGIGGEITCELPTKILTKFEGAYSASPSSAKTPITLSNVILRGCQVKQTEYCIGVSCVSRCHSLKCSLISSFKYVKM
jgi:hypothetical protein